jgi:hypothetical protein
MKLLLFHDYIFYMTCPWGKKAWKRDPSPAPKKISHWMIVVIVIITQPYVFWRDFICLHTWLPFPLNQFASNFC